MADLLGSFEQAVLLAIVRLRQDAYGRAILKDVQDRLQREVAHGAVHATLVRLECRKLVTSEVGDGSDVRGGRPRRYYRLSAAGRKALNDTRAAVEYLWSGFRVPLKGHS
jgi:DNA-binding PadR family transcriptional regulator